MMSSCCRYVLWAWDHFALAADTVMCLRICVASSESRDTPWSLYQYDEV